MSFPRYECYKESGVEWLGEVPEGWEVLPLRWFSTCSSGENISTDRIESDFDNQNSIPVIGGNGIMGFTNQQNINHPILAVGRVGALCGNVHIVHPPAWITDNALILDASSSSFNISYLAAVLKSRNLNDIAAKTAQPLITGTQVRDQRMPCPPSQEQQVIAAFLDRETGKIDELVTEQERLIALLKEKRQATISHAVTKGLNPDAPMKDSGIEWLGEVPVGWEVTSFKRIASIRYGIGEPPKYQEEGTPLIRATNVNAGLVTQEGMVFVNPDDIPEKRIIWLSAGDIIVVRSGAYTGDSAIIRIEHCPCIAGFDMVVHPKTCIPFFLQYALLSTYLKNDQLDLEKTRAAQPHLNAEELGSCVVVLPPSKEQSAIVAFLNSETAKIDALVGEAQQAVGLLKERRSALISAAVTGKIDVRNMETSI